MDALNNFLYIGLPYIAIVISVVGCIYRYRSKGFKVSSLSSQFLNSDSVFFGSMMFHWSILILFLAHLLAFLFPGTVLALNSNPVNLVIYESVGFMFGLGALFGLTWLFIRRMTNERVRVVTSGMDIFIELLILVQFVLGCWIAIRYHWGSSWFAAVLSPYLWSLLKLAPQIEGVSNLPSGVIMAHIAIAFVILGLIPFTRLVHFLVAPFHYISRPYQQVMWHWDRKRVRAASTAWSEARPKSN